MTSHYLNQCWSDSLTHICGTRGRRVNIASNHYLSPIQFQAIILTITNFSPTQHHIIKLNKILKILIFFPENGHEHIVKGCFFLFMLGCRYSWLITKFHVQYTNILTSKTSFNFLSIYENHKISKDYCKWYVTSRLPVQSQVIKGVSGDFVIMNKLIITKPGAKQFLEIIRVRPELYEKDDPYDVILSYYHYYLTEYRD